MEIVITGGGTGGHIYPALEVARELENQGHGTTYLGSHRGQEGAICRKLGIEFQAFASAPLYSLKQLRGWKSALTMFKATLDAKAYLSKNRPDRIFSTGGYSAAPVMHAARSLKIPLVIHESNSIPGRSNRMFAPCSQAFTCVFEITKTVVSKAIKTGQPIRQQLRDAAGAVSWEERSMIFCLGGSQGSEFLNGIFPKAAAIGNLGDEYLLAAGKSNYANLGGLPANLTAVPFLEADQITDAYRRTKVGVARSGGTVAELAMFGIPSVLIPLPTSADDHQLKNAEEFVSFGGAKLLRQAEATPERLSASIEEWLTDEVAYQNAFRALRNWDRPDATQSIATLVLK